MKMHKFYSITITFLCIVSSCYALNQRFKAQNSISNIELLEEENKKLSVLSKELKKSIDIKDKNIVSLKQELEKKSSFNTPVHFNPDNITEPSGVSYEQLSYALKDTNLLDYIDSFLTVEKTYNINALAMIGIVANESAWLTSDRTLRQNNVTGYAVYSDSSKGASFLSIDECIIKTAELLSKDYLNPQGKYYQGLSVSNVNIMYSSDEKWDDTVSNIGSKLKNEINEIVDKIRS